MGGVRLGRVMLISGAAAALLAGVACSSSGNGSKTPAGGTAVVSQAPAATPTAMPADVATAVSAKGAAEMVDYTDKDGRYTVTLPRGWTIETNTNVMTATLAGDPVTATVGIFCLPDSDISRIEAFDNQIMQSTGAPLIPFASGVATKVGTADAVQIPYTGGLAGLPLDRVLVYFVGNGCAWRIQMTVWPGTTVDELKPILETMKSSFAFKS